MGFSTLQERLKNLAPRSLRQLAKRVLKNLRAFRNKKQQLRGSAIGRAEILSALRNLGVRDGDILIVHSSLSRLGYVEGGVDTIVSALQDSVGSAGTLGAPTFWALDPNTVEEGTIFDVEQGRSKLGVISEKIRTLPGAFRSYHPTHSATFIGDAARQLTADHHLDKTPVGPNSPFRKLVQLHGKILMLGVSLEYLTSFHTIEDEIENFRYNLYNSEERRFRVKGPDGQLLVLDVKIHDPQTARLRQCMKMEPYLTEAGVLVKGVVGEGNAMLLDATGLHEELHRLYRKGVTIYSP